MLGFRPVAKVIAVMVFASPLFAQSPTIVRDTSALGRLPVFITAGAPPAAIDVRAGAREWTSPRQTTTPVARPPATWLNGDGSRATSAAMMIVGGTALLAGTVISGKPGTRIMIGGGVLGLVGLWRYAK